MPHFRSCSVRRTVGGTPPSGAVYGSEIVHLTTPACRLCRRALKDRLRSLRLEVLRTERQGREWRKFDAVPSEGRSAERLAAGPFTAPGNNTTTGSAASRKRVWRYRRDLKDRLGSLRLEVLRTERHGRECRTFGAVPSAGRSAERLSAGSFTAPPGCAAARSLANS